MAPNKKEVANDEKSGLLSKNAMPSPASTDFPSASKLFGYGAATDGSGNEPLIQMSNSNADLYLPYADSNNGSFDSLEGGDPNFRRQVRRKKLMTRGIALAVCLAVALGVYGLASGPATPKKTSDQLNPSENNHEEANIPDTSTKPLSKKHPVTDLKIPEVLRTSAAPNEDLFGPNTSPARPTNAWYENLVLCKGEPTEEQRVYPLPYLVDTVGPLAGIRVNSPTVKAGATDIQLIEIPQHGLTVGAAAPAHVVDGTVTKSKAYTITQMTPLGITLEWNGTDAITAEKDEDAFSYSSSIVRGMPYATVKYRNTRNTDGSLAGMVPSIVTEIALGKQPLIDGTSPLKCHKRNVVMNMLNLHNPTTKVEQEVVLQFTESDYTWIVFVSRPVHVQCVTSTSSKKGINPFMLQFVDDIASDNDDDSSSSSSRDLVVRVALMNDCTAGGNPMSCGSGSGHHNDTELGHLLRKNADLYPGPNTDMDYTFISKTHGSSESAAAAMTFDWNVQSMTKSQKEMSSSEDSDNGHMLMYALPHHQDLMSDSSHHAVDPPVYAQSSEGDKVCQSTLLGRTCLVQGTTWKLHEDFESHNFTSFRAPRPPHHTALPALVNAYQDDLSYSLPSYFERGAGDTYFSGKMLAKMARILTIGEELEEICSSDSEGEIPTVCQDLDIPSVHDSDFQDAVARLRSGVEIWINGTGATPFVYDARWGGLVSCGCDFDGKHSGGVCRNKFPECPGFEDPGLNFGNAFYNDHHFHYGYHIYAAAAVAHFDPKWGRKHFEEVMLYIRDIANPSKDDTAFPTFRQKDWYQGSSWASGIAVSPLNGRNQESSSEAIASYEAIGLFGKEMVQAFKEDPEQAAVAEQVFNYGQLLTASEIRSAKKYWHVLESAHKRQYPKEYTSHAIGMLWTTMAQFQTWFGNKPYLAIGIQLIPLTAVSEERDSLEWVLELYQQFADSCDAALDVCEAQGWSVLVMAMLATVGHQDDAIEQALGLNATEVFSSAGGNGHSLTNTLWYLSTRPYVAHPLAINSTSTGNSTSGENSTSTTATDDEYDGDESNNEDSGSSKTCPPCSQKVCQGPFNKCPMPNAPFLCTEGQNTGGCARAPWELADRKSVV